MANKQKQAEIYLIISDDLSFDNLSDSVEYLVDNAKAQTGADKEDLKAAMHDIVDIIIDTME